MYEEDQAVIYNEKIITSVNINNYRNRIRRKQKSVVGLWMAFFVFLMSIGTGNQIFGQNLCNTPGGGGFTLAAPSICLGKSVVVTPDAGLANDSYVYLYDGVASVSALAAQAITNRGFQYAQPGSYTILQFASKGATGVTACQVVNVYPTSKLEYTYQICPSATGAGYTVKLNFTLDAITKTYDKIEVNWGDGQGVKSYPMSSVNNISYTYTNPGNYLVQVNGAFNVNVGCITEKNIQPIPVRPKDKPVITTLTSTGAGAKIDIQATPGDVVELLQKNGSTFQPTGLTAMSGASISVSGTSGTTQCFQLQVKGGCATELSDEVCTLNLSAVSGNQQNTLTWQPYEGKGYVAFASGYSISRTDNGVTGSPTQISTPSTVSTRQLVDNNGIQCGVQYCYTLQARVLTVSGFPTTVISSPVCVTGQSAALPAAPTNLQVSVADNGQIEVRNVTTGLPTAFTMLVLRADSPAGPFQQVGSVSNSTVFKDPGANPNAQSYCYQIVFQNNCGNVSTPSKPVCSVWLGSLSTGIDWTADSPFTPGTVSRYVLEIYDTGTNTLYKEIPLGGNTHYEPDPNDQSTQTFRYRIRAESATGESTSNYFELKRNASIFVPTAFTPNGDGQNDRFLVLGTFLDNFEMIIYSRWGDPIYQTTSLTEGWDGNIGGQQAPTGAYAYRINVRDKDGQQIVKRGTVTLLR